MLTKEVWIPLLRSLITGLLAGVLLFALGALFAWDSPGALAAIGGISISLLVWWVSVRQAWRVLGGDLGQVVEIIEPERVRLQLNHQDGQGADWLDLPVELPRMIAISERVLDGGSFSHASLAGPGRPLSRSEYETLRDVFLARGLASWINPEAHSQGLRLSGKGRAVARGFASMAADLPQLTTRIYHDGISSPNTQAHTRTQD